MKISEIYHGNRAVREMRLNGVVKNFIETSEESMVKYLDSATLTGTWLNSSVTGFDGTPTKYSNTTGDTTEWEMYAKVTGNYDIYVWIPDSGATSVLYTISTADGVWSEVVDQRVVYNKWHKIKTVSAQSGTGISVLLTVYEPFTRVNAVKFETTDNEVDEMQDPTSSFDTNTKMIYLNQSGYDVDKPKRATITNVEDGTAFYIKEVSTQGTVYTGNVSGMIADFTDFRPNEFGGYYIECDDLQSYNFMIGKYITQRVSVPPNLKFMIESREDGFAKNWEKGYGWRDSHQFTFELNVLVPQYMANPSLFERMPYRVTHLDVTEYSELSVQNEPDIIWLIKFAVMRYHDLAINHGVLLHSLIKEQLAYFLYLYPDIKQYVDHDFYIMIRDFTIAQWTNPECNLSWYDTPQSYSHNLLIAQNHYGDTKGMLPPGHAITPNLMMYEVAKRDGLSYQQYFDAAYANAEWLINDVDLDDPMTTKGQRMSEHITMTNLAYFKEKYPDLAPSGISAKIERWADVMISRSDNLWDLRKFSDPNDITDSEIDQWTGGGNQYNEPGNLAGFAASAYAVCRVLTDDLKIKRLKEIAVAQLDTVFGRNPFGRHFSFKATSEIEGADTNWFKRMNGFGELSNVPGSLDGSPKEVSYPFAPLAHYGYSEGWVAYNTAWIHSLAYHSADDISIDATKVGDVVKVKLRAPLNFDETSIELGEVDVVDNLGNHTKISVSESSMDDYYFEADYAVPSGVESLTFSYGYGMFKVSKNVNTI